MIGHFSENVESLLDLLRREDKKYLKALTKKDYEPDSDIAYQIERLGGTHASMGRNPSTKSQFQKVRYGREWPREEWFHHKGFPKWHPEEKMTLGVQKPPISRSQQFYPEAKAKH
jgi:hypothetical protein